MPSPFNPVLFSAWLSPGGVWVMNLAHYRTLESPRRWKIESKVGKYVLDKQSDASCEPTPPSRGILSALVR